ncbi:MAG TPA: response regulator [Candidatus Thermoplasmatota archaeon]|nr:response regulator [Candidatus Thermoplasmatota archaeon]
MDGDGLRVLLVEDDPAQARVAQHAMEGLRVRHAPTLAAALAALEEGPFDAIVLDLMLPDSHGIGTLERVLAAAPRLPVVVVTGAAGGDLGAEAVRRGAQDYLTKADAMPSALPRAVRHAVERRRAEDELLQARIARPLVRSLFSDLVRRSRLHETELRDMGAALARQVEAATCGDFAAAYERLGLADELRCGRAGDGRYEFQARDLFERRPHARETTCHLTLGYLQEAVRLVEKREALGSETACQSRGDPACAFAVRAR